MWGKNKTCACTISISENLENHTQIPSIPRPQGFDAFDHRLRRCHQRRLCNLCCSSWILGKTHPVGPPQHLPSCRSLLARTMLVPYMGTIPNSSFSLLSVTHSVITGSRTFGTADLDQVLPGKYYRL